MLRILTASADTYITDKIVDGVRVTDANVGHAATLDLFKLYGETRLTGDSSDVNEISRILLKFDLQPLHDMTSSIDITHSSFKCVLKLFDIYGGQTTPTNFTLQVLPLSRSFDEGFGLDVASFQDLDSANFVTASVSQGISAWAVTGANGLGLLGSSDIDVIASGVLDSTVEQFGVTQIFRTGDEDMSVNVTRLVSATLVGLIPDRGFRVAFSGTQETDTVTRFVKRFSSRHSSNPNVRPRLVVTFDDSVHDDHECMTFDVSGSLFLRNTVRGELANLVSGSTLSQLTGANCATLTLVSGNFSSSYSVSQHRVGSTWVTGLYSASFLVRSDNASLVTEIRNANSATFSEFWKSTDGTVAFLTSSLVIKSLTRDAFDASSRRFVISVTNVKKTYNRSEKARFRVFSQETSPEADYKVFRTPRQSVSHVSRNYFYQIRDAFSNEIIVPFDDVSNTTRMSSDSRGMYFDVYIDSFSPGRVYVIDVMVKDAGVSEIHSSASPNFRVE